MEIRALKLIPFVRHIVKGSMFNFSEISYKDDESCIRTFHQGRPNTCNSKPVPRGKKEKLVARY